MSTQNHTPTVLQLVVDDVLLAFINLPGTVQFGNWTGRAIIIASTLGQMQEAARLDDAPRVLELLPWLVDSLDVFEGSLLDEWLAIADTIKRAALGAPVSMLPSWVAAKQKRVSKNEWEAIGCGRPFKKVAASLPAPKKPNLRLVAYNE